MARKFDMFQFYLSSIKSLRNFRMDIRLRVFQFYLSSIKRIENTGNGELLKMFQFYLSSIKSKLVGSAWV